MNSDPDVSIRSIADVEAFETIPLEERITRWTIPDVVEQSAAQFGDAVALAFLQNADPAETPLSMTYKQLARRATATANMLWRVNGARPAVVAILLPLIPESYDLLCGGTAAAILCPINPALTPARMAEIITRAGAETLVTLGPTPGFDIWDTARELLDLCPAIRQVVQVQGPGGQRGKAPDFATLVAAESDKALAFHRPITGADAAIYCPTGGTTGAPKLAMLSHRSIVYKCHAFRWVLGHGPGDVILAGLPLFHVGGIVSRTLSPLSSGITSVVVSPHGFRLPASRKNYWGLVERYRVTELVAPPTMLAALLNEPLQGHDISSLKPFANTGSAGLPVGIAHAFEQRGIRISGNYGLTEYTASAALSPRSHDHPRGSSGIRIPYTQMKTVITDKSGNELRDGRIDETGILAIRGPGAISGYVGHGARGRLFFADGWIDTGDIGRLDTEANVWVTGRVKDMIIRGGHNIDPSAIENTLLGYPGVESAAAVGRPDAYAGELPIAYVQARPGFELDAQAIKAFAQSAISERGSAPVDVVVLDRMPLTEVGKLYKLPLRAHAARSVFESVLKPLSTEAADIDVQVGFDTGQGLRVVICVKAAGPSADVVRQIRETMDRYTLPYAVETNDSANRMDGD